MCSFLSLSLFPPWSEELTEDPTSQGVVGTNEIMNGLRSARASHTMRIEWQELSSPLFPLLAGMWPFLAASLGSDAEPLSVWTLLHRQGQVRGISG